MTANLPRQTSEQPAYQYDEAPPPHPALQVWDEWQGYIIPLGLVLLTFVIFIGALGNDWVIGWEDDFYILSNEKVNDFSVGNLIDNWTGFRRGEYIPLSLTFYSVEHLIFGNDAGGYHLVSVLLHALSGVLVYWSLSQLQPRQWIAGLAAVIFLIHPLQVENVAWISQQKTVLSGSLFMASLGLHIYASRKKGRSSALVVSYVLFALSMLAKPMAVLAPLLFILLDYNWTRLGSSRILLRNAPYIVISVLGAVLVLLAQNDNGGLPASGTSSLLQRAQLVLWAVWDYVAALLLPLNLNNLYIYDLSKIGFGNPRIWLGLVAILGSGALAVLQPKRLTMTGVIGFWLFLLPLLNIIPTGYPRADRFMYLPLLAFALLFALFIAKLWDWLPRQEMRLGVVIFTAVVLVVYIASTFNRVGKWENLETLMLDHLTDYPASATGLNKLSQYYLATGDIQRAIEVTADLVRTDPNDPAKLDQLALVAMARGNYQAAAELYQQSLALRPGDRDSQVRLGAALVQWGVQLYDQGNYDAAINAYLAALDYIPEQPLLHNNIGFTFFTQGRYQEALVAYNQALTLDPNYAKAWINLADTALQVGNFELARNGYARAVELGAEPNAQSSTNFCRTLNELRQDPEVALVFCERAVQLVPNFIQGWTNFGEAALISGNYTLAVNNYARAVQLGAELNARHSSNFCLAVGQLGQDAQTALTFCQRAIDLEPTNGLYWGRSAHVLLIFGDYETARSVAQRAVEIDPNLALNQRVLGDAYRLTGNVEGARAAYMAALALNPNSEEAQAGLALLDQGTVPPTPAATPIPVTPTPGQ